MISCETTITSPMAQPRAFDYLTDLERIGEWHPSVLESRLEAGEPGLRHSRYRVLTQVGPFRLATMVEVVELDRPRHFAYTATTRLSFSAHELTFIGRGPGVEVLARSTLELVPGLGPISPLADRYLDSYCEGRADGMRVALGEQVETGPVWVPGLHATRRGSYRAGA